LAAIPDGSAKTDGVAVGEAAANAILAHRANDGSDVVVPYTPGTELGDWRPTPPDLTPAFMPGLGNIVPFGIENGAQFRLGPPPAIHTSKYARDNKEIKKIGEVARFYEVADALPIYNPAARQVSAAQGKTLSQNARIFALINMAIFDAAVAVFDSKYHYNYWRPVTAIRDGDKDKNRKTDPDANWLPLIFTPPFPSYPSGHAGFGGAARYILEEIFGAAGHSISLTHPKLPGTVLRYSNWKQITDDIDDGRIYGGVHYRFDQEAGAFLGRRVGAYILKHKLRPISDRSKAAAKTKKRQVNAQQ
jgi:membrane-associated phospholipid phosphatase